MSTIYVGNVIHCKDDKTVESFEKGFIIVENGKIIDIGNEEKLHVMRFGKAIPRVDLEDSEILIPGLIDTHIHAPQYPNAGLGYDLPLLEWLKKYTYELESKFSDLEYSTKVYDAVVKKTIAFGTTTACYYASMFKDSSFKLAESVAKIGQRALIGKVNMTQDAPEEYIDTMEQSLKDTYAFHSQINGLNNDLVKTIITPRFALSCEMELMQKLGEYAKSNDLHIQTHISENLDEIALVKERFNVDTYAEVYEQAKLLTPKTVLAHGVHLEDSECKLIAERGASVSHCPSSNVRLQSGQCDVKRLISKGINVALGTDCAGGQSTSIIESMRLSVDNSIHLSFTTKDYKPIDYKDAFYMATLGGAKALAMGDKIGNFTVGKDFDALVVNLDVAKSSSDYLKKCTAMELLQKFVYVGDDRNVVQVFVAGKSVKSL